MDDDELIARLAHGDGDAPLERGYTAILATAPGAS